MEVLFALAELSTAGDSTSDDRDTGTGTGTSKGKGSTLRALQLLYSNPSGPQRTDPTHTDAACSSFSVFTLVVDLAALAVPASLLALAASQCAPNVRAWLTAQAGAGAGASSLVASGISLEQLCTNPRHRRHRHRHRHRQGQGQRHGKDRHIEVPSHTQT